MTGISQDVTAGRAAPAPAGGDPHLRAAALARALTSDGYAASLRSMVEPGLSAGPGAADSAGSAGKQLCQGHCPIQQVAARFPQLCEAETQAFSALLGVHVQRLATLAHGEHVCTTHIPPAQPPSPPQPGSQPESTTSHQERAADEHRVAS